MSIIRGWEILRKERSIGAMEKKREKNKIEF